MTLPIIDPFTYPNGSLAGRGSWTVPIGTVNVSSNRAVGIVDLLGLALSEAAPTYSMDVSIDQISHTEAGSATDVCVSSYYNSGSDYGYMFGSYDHGTGRWNLACNVNGSFTVFAHLTEAAPAEPYTMRLVNCRGRLKLYVNGVLKLTGTDTVGLHGLHGGFAVGNAGDAMDNFVYRFAKCGGWRAGLGAEQADTWGWLVAR